MQTNMHVYTHARPPTHARTRCCIRYDNEAGYACRLVDVAAMVAKGM